MATFNTIANLFRAGGQTDRGVDARTAERAVTAVARIERDVNSVREIPHERIYLYSKTLDNSRVVKEVNQETEAMSWKTIVGASATAILLIFLLIPVSSNVLAGYRVHALQEEGRGLLEQRAELELEEAKLLAPERLAELARIQHFVEAGKARVIYSNPKSGEAVAGLSGAVISPVALSK